MTTTNCKKLIKGFDEYGPHPICAATGEQCNYQAHILVYKRGKLSSCPTFLGVDN